MNRSRIAIKERQNQIIEELDREGTVYTADLCKKCNVTDMTIRRDLSHLEEKGVLKRFHGGAKRVFDSSQAGTPHGEVQYIKNPSVVNTISDRVTRNATRKDCIAQRAAELIEPGEVIFLNSGTTGLYLLRYLEGKNVRIVSNNAAIALVDRPADTELTITGGEHFTRTQSFVGPVAKNTLMNVVATKCLLSVSGISRANGITCSSLQETEINNLMIQRCQGKRIVIADGSKVGASFCFISCQIRDIDILVTDRSADEEELEKLRSSGINIILAD